MSSILCPRCHSNIAANSVQQRLMICPACGHSTHPAQKQDEKQIDKTFLNLSIAISIFLVAGFIHLMNWDRHASAIVPLKAKQYLGTASLYDYSQIITICKERGKPDCVLGAYKAAVTAYPQNLKALGLYGHTLTLLKKDALAARILSRYFAQGGQDPHRAFDLAKVLKRNNKTREAEKYFKLALKSKPNVVQISVIQAYVDMLIKTRRLRVAANLIERTRKTGAHATMFMEGELRAIRQQMRQRGA